MDPQDNQNQPMGGDDTGSGTGPQDMPGTEPTPSAPEPTGPADTTDTGMPTDSGEVPPTTPTGQGEDTPQGGDEPQAQSQ